LAIPYLKRDRSLHNENLLDLKFVKRSEKLGICVNDAGAANQIHALLKGKLEKKIRVFASGPALDIFKQSYGEDVFCGDINELVDWADILIAGTGWMTNVEKQGLAEAIEQDKKCIAYFDHWANYSSRLTLNGNLLQPSAIWVSDKEAMSLAVEHYPNIPVVQVPNFYLKYETAKIGPLKNNNHSVLYVCEPIFNNGVNSLELTLEPIYFAIEQLRSGYFGNISKFIIRPHPSQKPEIFFPLLTEEANFQIEISDTKSLAEDISAASKVIGLNSFALLIAAAANREIFCSAPPSWRQSKLKLQNFRYLRDL
jgi:hypothetical protein